MKKELPDGTLVSVSEEVYRAYKRMQSIDTNKSQHLTVEFIFILFFIKKYNFFYKIFPFFSFTALYYWEILFLPSKGETEIEK